MSAPVCYPYLCSGTCHIGCNMSTCLSLLVANMLLEVQSCSFLTPTITHPIGWVSSQSISGGRRTGSAGRWRVGLLEGGLKSQKLTTGWSVRTLGLESKQLTCNLGSPTHKLWVTGKWLCFLFLQNTEVTIGDVYDISNANIWWFHK